jgi:hypothetical protein
MADAPGGGAKAGTPKAGAVHRQVPASDGGSDCCGGGGSDQSLQGARAAAQAAALGLGTPDAWLVGRGWRLAVHRALLCARCELLRAKWCSGMRDAHDGEVQVRPAAPPAPPSCAAAARPASAALAAHTRPC